MSQQTVGFIDYVAQGGDTFDSIALVAYNEERMASTIITANPDLCDPSHPVGTDPARFQRRLAIVCLGERAELVPRVIADKIAERDASLVVRAKKVDAAVDADDPYAAYQVPDDLMW